MARGGSSIDDIVKAVLKQINESRPAVVSAGKGVADDAGKLASGAAAAVKKALGKGKTPKVTSKTAKTVTPKPSKSASKPMTKEERRLANQRADAERRAARADETVEQRATRKKENREKFLATEKSKIEKRMTASEMRQSGYPLISNALTKKMNSVDFKTRLLSNRGGMLDKEVDEQTMKLVGLYQKDGRKLTPTQVRKLRGNVKAEIKSFAERNLDKLSRSVETRLTKLGKMTPQELDTEAGRMAFRAKKAKARKGVEPKDSRRDYQIRQDKELNERLEALDRKRADAKRNRGTGTPTGPRPRGPESAKARERRLSAAASERKLAEAQAENAKKALEAGPRKPLFYSSSKKYSAKELKGVKTTTGEQAAEARKYLSQSGEGYNIKPPVKLVERNAFGMTREEFAAYKAKQAKGAKVPKKK